MQDRCEIMVEDVLPVTIVKQDSKHYHDYQWKQLHVCFLFPFPFQMAFVSTEQKPRDSWQKSSCSDTQTTLAGCNVTILKICDLQRRRLRGLFLSVTLTPITTTNRAIMSASGLSVQCTQNKANTDSVRCRELSAYSQKHKWLTKPVLLALNILCILRQPVSKRHHGIRETKQKKTFKNSFTYTKFLIILIWS